MDGAEDLEIKHGYPLSVGGLLGFTSTLRRRVGTWMWTREVRYSAAGRETFKMKTCLGGRRVMRREYADAWGQRGQRGPKRCGGWR